MQKSGFKRMGASAGQILTRRRVYFATILMCIWLVYLGLWPGGIAGQFFAFPLGCVTLPLLCCWFLLLICLTGSELRKGNAKLGRSSLHALIAVFLTLAMLWWHIPQRVGFLFSRSEFKTLVEETSGGPSRGVIGRRIGMYYVDSFEIDSRGGTYFRTHRAFNGISPDETSYGLVFRPNTEGSPYGDTAYQIQHLFDEWYTFEATT